jgi:hypothetical protein
MTGPRIGPRAVFGDPRRPWTAAEIATAARLWAELTAAGVPPGPAYAEIGRALGRKPAAVQSRRKNFGESFAASPRSKLPPTRVTAGEATAPRASLLLLAARDRRSAALDRRDLTARLMGDPPPGYSALDRSRKAAS